MTKVHLILLTILFSFSGIAQKEKAIVSLPKSYAIYVGYDNIVKISFNKRRARKISIECESCEFIKPLNKDENEWLLRVSEIKPVNIIVKNRRGKKIGYKSFVVLPPPKPIVHLDSLNAQFIIKDIPNRIKLKLPSSIPLNAGYQVRQWIAKIENKIFRGNGSFISDEVVEYLKKSKTGTIVFNIIYRSAFEENEIKEIFQYSLE
tara:strand:+ start:60 stop:674 length:615 start_codon:yes stop_codon:yes gene_type:complete